MENSILVENDQSPEHFNINNEVMAHIKEEI